MTDLKKIRATSGHSEEKTAARTPRKRGEQEGVSPTDGSHQGEGAWTRKGEVRWGVLCCELLQGENWVSLNNVSWHKVLDKCLNACSDERERSDTEQRHERKRETISDTKVEKQRIIDRLALKTIKCL